MLWLSAQAVIEGAKINSQFMFQLSQFLKTLVGNRALATPKMLGLFCDRGAFWLCRYFGGGIDTRLPGVSIREEAFLF